MSNKMLTMYELQKHVKESMIEEIKYNLKEYETTELEDDAIHEIVDSCVPIYTRDIFELACSDLSLNYSDSELGYPDNPTPEQILQTNIYCELRNYAYLIKDELEEQYEEIQK